MIAQATLANMCEVAILLCAPGWLVVSEAKQLSILSAMVFADRLFYIQSFLFAFTFAFDTALRHGNSSGTALGATPLHDEAKVKGPIKCMV